MAERKSHVVVVSNDVVRLREWVEGLNASAQATTNDVLDRFLFLPCSSAADLQSRALSDGLLQAAIIDGADPSAGQTLEKVHESRAELNLFLAATPGSSAPAGIQQASRAELLDRNDHNYNRMFRQVKTAVLRRARTPFADTLRDYVFSAKDAWHTPGHSGGDSLRDSPWVDDFYRMMGEHIFNTDLSVSVQALDSLLEPHSVIQEAQDLAAIAFGADRTFFITNGTSTANKVIVQHVLGAGGKMIVDQACHKSIHHAIILNGITPVYLAAASKPEYGFYGPVPKQTIYAAIDAHRDASLLTLTSCTYDGFYYDLEPIIDYAHQHGIKVLIDEAWYAHGRFHPAFRPTALECGADYVTQSTHKMLSAFSQASMIHVAEPGFDEHRFRENLNMHTSTSPQYAMIASLDVARKQMSMEGFSQLSRLLDVTQRLRDGIAETGAFQALELQNMLPDSLRDDGIRLDSTKLTIDVSGSGMSARQVQLALFEHYGIQAEKITHNTISLLVTLGTTESKVLRLLNALRKLASRQPGDTRVRERHPTRLPMLSHIEQLPQEAYFGPCEVLPLLAQDHSFNTSLSGRICADQIVPYPPGIPVLVPGQRITDEIGRFLVDLYHGSSGVELHGLILDEDDPGLRVTTTT